jgi:NAD(P)H-dependent FMN reductase
MSLKLQVIVGSTRPGRIGPSVAKWFAEFAEQHSEFEVELVDLADFHLPIYDEAAHPRMQQYEHEHTKRWSAKVQAADAYVFVTPEYNFGPPPALLNALNYLYKEWNYKPCGFVSYGGLSGGMRAVQMEKLLVTTLKMMPMVEAVALPMVWNHLTEAGQFASNELVDDSAKGMLAELGRWATALKPMRG